MQFFIAWVKLNTCSKRAAVVDDGEPPAEVGGQRQVHIVNMSRAFEVGHVHRGNLLRAEQGEEALAVFVLTQEPVWIVGHPERGEYSPQGPRLGEEPLATDHGRVREIHTHRFGRPHRNITAAVSRPIIKPPRGSNSIPCYVNART